MQYFKHEYEGFITGSEHEMKTDGRSPKVFTVLECLESPDETNAFLNWFV